MPALSWCGACALEITETIDTLTLDVWSVACLVILVLTGVDFFTSEASSLLQQAKDIVKLHDEWVSRLVLVRVPSTKLAMWLELVHGVLQRCMFVTSVCHCSATTGCVLCCHLSCHKPDLRHRLRHKGMSVMVQWNSASCSYLQEAALM